MSNKDLVKDSPSYKIGYEQGRADERDRIVKELEEEKATAIDLVKLPNFIKKDLKELTDMCFDEAIEIVKEEQNEGD